MQTEEQKHKEHRVEQTCRTCGFQTDPSPGWGGQLLCNRGYPEMIRLVVEPDHTCDHWKPKHFTVGHSRIGDGSVIKGDEDDTC